MKSWRRTVVERYSICAALALASRFGRVGLVVDLVLEDLFHDVFERHETLELVERIALHVQPTTQPHRRLATCVDTIALKISHVDHAAPVQCC